MSARTYAERQVEERTALAEQLLRGTPEEAELAKVRALGRRVFFTLGAKIHEELAGLYAKCKAQEDEIATLRARLEALEGGQT